MNHNSKSMNSLLMFALTVGFGGSRPFPEIEKEEKKQTADDLIKSAGDPTEDELSEAEQELLEREEMEEQIAEEAFA